MQYYSNVSDLHQWLSQLARQWEFYSPGSELIYTVPLLHVHYSLSAVENAFVV